MEIVRKIHDQFRVKTLAGSTLQSPTSTSDSTGSSNTYITITGGSLGGGGLSEADRSKLNSIEQGAQVNQDAFSKVLLETTNREQEQQTTTSSSIIANIPSDTANIRLVGNYPIKVSLESVSLFNYNTVTTTGDIVATYNVSYNEYGNVVIDYVSGALFNTSDIELIRIQHKDKTIARYDNTQFEYTESEGTITKFIIPYQGTDFSSIQFCRYETNSTESTDGTETVRELSVITELLVSPTKQQIITLSDTNANYWKYEEDENGNRYLWTDCNVYSTKEVSAYGKAAEQETPTILNLSQLQDVLLTNLANNQVLVYSSSSQKWINVDASNLGISADNLKTLTITVNGASYTYNPATSNQSISITTITLDDVLPYISSKLDREEFFKWFTINYDSNNNVTSIQANYDFYSVKGISAYGLGDIGSTTRTTLSSLDDVNLSNLAVDNMLAYNGSKWVNIPMSQVRGVTSWADLENKPTTVSGFGITDVYTKTEVNTKISEVSSKVTELSSSKADAAIQVIAGGGLTGGGSLQQDVTIALQNLNSTGTYYKINVDTYGRVTSGISYLTIDDIQNLQTQLDSKLNIADFNTWFTIIYNTDGTIKNIRANYDFYSVGEVSAYGIGDEEKKTYTTLAELNDVQLTNIKATDVLVYNGTKWVNVDQSTIKGAQSWVDIQNKPTTISGFGIVDAYTKTEIDNKLSPINSSITTINSSINTINANVSDLSSSLSSVSTKLNNFLEGSDTDTIINKWKELEAFLAGYTQTQTLADLLSVKANSSIQIIAGTGLVGGGDLTANRTISLSTSGVSAGTYTKVTVDTYGRVTSGGTLSSTDIPNLDWSKITSGKPTTLAGYGITDGVNNITFTGSGNAITAVTISNHLLTFTKGETFLPKSTFDDLFEKVNVGTTSNPVYAIKAKYHLYSVGEVSAYEFGETNGTGASSLEELTDVQLTNLVADSILKYNGSKWVNIPITEVKGATSWNEIEGKPSTFTPSAHTHTVADITDISTKYITKDMVEGVLTGNITSHTHSYLPLSGGTITGDLSLNQYLRINDWSGYGSGSANIQYDGTIKQLKCGDVANISLQNGELVIHSSNYSNYALPLSGGTMDGALTVKQYIFGYNCNHAGGNAPAFVFDKPGSYYTGIGANGETDTIYFSTATISNGEASWVTSYKQKWKFNGTIYQEDNAVIHAGNIGSQSVNYATSAGNADTATKLQTARTIWGQSFDGTGNVSGSLSNTGTITASAAGTYDIGSNTLDYRCGYFQWIGAKSNTNLRLAANNSDNQIVLHTNGNVGIGTTSPSVKLHVIGDIAATGEVTAKASSSDIRLKTDITDYKALSIIRGHKSIKYHWNAVAKANADIFNDDYWHYGLIAQDVQRDMPQMVSDVFKDYLVINYERLIPICWKGLQEVDDEVTKLKKRVKQLEKRLQKYESTEVFYTKGND